MAFYSGVKSDFGHLQTELKEIGEIYASNRRQFEKLKSKTPYLRVKDKNEELFYQLRDMFNEVTAKKYSDALLYFFINKTAYSGMIRYNSKGEFNVPYGRYPNLNTALVTAEHHKLLGHAQIYNLDYGHIFKMANKDDFMFLDPPYDCIFSDYGNAQYKEGFDELHHIELAKNYRQLKCKALMVIGKTPLTQELYKEMIVDEYGKSYAVNIRNRFKSAASHLIVSNYSSVPKKRSTELVLEEAPI